jgi:hypothetical protein
VRAVRARHIAVCLFALLWGVMFWTIYERAIWLIGRIEIWEVLEAKRAVPLHLEHILVVTMPAIEQRDFFIFCTSHPGYKGPIQSNTCRFLVSRIESSATQCEGGILGFGTSKPFRQDLVNWNIVERALAMDIIGRGLPPIVDINGDQIVERVIWSHLRCCIGTWRPTLGTIQFDILKPNIRAQLPLLLIANYPQLPSLYDGIGKDQDYSYNLENKTPLFEAIGFFIISPWAPIGTRETVKAPHSCWNATQWQFCCVLSLSAAAPTSVPRSLLERAVGLSDQIERSQVRKRLAGGGKGPPTNDQAKKAGR